MRAFKVLATTAFAAVGALAMTARCARRLLTPIDVSPP